MRIKVCGKFEEWDAAKVRAERERQAKSSVDTSLYAFDDGWLSQWAHGQTDVKLGLIEEILAEPVGTSEVFVHCGEKVAHPNSRFGGFYTCRKCGFKANETVVWNWRDKSGRRDLGAEGLSIGTESWAKAITMNRSNYSYGICRESDEHQPVTAAQAGLV